MVRQADSSTVFQPRLEPAILKSLREERGLNFQQWADLLGIPGGRSTVHGWESGNSICQGVYARLVQLTTGYQKAALDLTKARVEVDGLWMRAGGTPYKVYRQMAFAFEPQPEVPLSRFLTLASRAQLTDPRPDNCFPLLDGPFEAAVARSRQGWRFVVPTSASEAPAYIWVLKPELSFVYREKAWEDTALAITRGDVDASYTVLHALQSILFALSVSKAEMLPDDTVMILRLEVGGVTGRRFVDRDRPDCRGFSWAEESQVAELRVRFDEGDPIEAAIELVSQLATPANPALAAPTTLRDICRRDSSSPDRGPHWQRLLQPAGLKF